MEKFKAGRPKRHDKRRKLQINCVICGNGMDSLRNYCGATCRKRAERERNMVLNRIKPKGPDDTFNLLKGIYNKKILDGILQRRALRDIKAENRDI